jgi:hypothetical protein
LIGATRRIIERVAPISLTSSRLAGITGLHLNSGQTNTPDDVVPELAAQLSEEEEGN